MEGRKLGHFVELAIFEKLAKEGSLDVESIAPRRKRSKKRA